MRRAVTVAAIAAAVMARAAWGQIADTQCTFPDPLDSLQTVSPGQLITSRQYNTIECAVNRLERRALDTPRAEVLCTNVTVSGAELQIVELTASAPFLGSETIVPSAQDDATAPRLEPASFQTPVTGSSIVKIGVFNRDEDTAHTGKVCAHVVRP